MATHKPVSILLVLERSEEREAEYAVYSGLISLVEKQLLDIFESGGLWAPRNAEVDANLALLSYFSEKIPVDAWRLGNPVDEGHLDRVVPEAMRKMLKALQRKYIRETYQYVIINGGVDDGAILDYVRYLQQVVRRSPGLLNRWQEDTIEDLPRLLGLRTPNRDRSPEREKIIPSSSQDPD